MRGSFHPPVAATSTSDAPTVYFGSSPASGAVAPMTNCLRAPVRVLAIVLAIPALAAWDAAGHRTVAEITWESMTLRARERAVALLMHGPAEGTAAERDRALFVNAATWADLVRNPHEPWHGYSHPTWHYADFYWDVENGRPHEIPGTGPDSVAAGERAVAFRGLLAASTAAATTKAVALAWLLHLVGDIHQPL